MSEKTSTIKEVMNVREWTGDRGTVFYFQLEMDNGDIGNIGKKSKDALKVGDSLTYTIEETDKGNKFKPVQQNSFNGGGFKGQPQSKDSSFALSYAKDVTVAMISKDLIPAERMNSTDIAKGTIHIANEFLKWLKENN